MLGEEHPDALESKNDLAMLYEAQAHYNEIEELLLGAIEDRLLKLDNQYPHILEILNNLIDLYEAWNKPEKAEQ